MSNILELKSQVSKYQDRRQKKAVFVEGVNAILDPKGKKSYLDRSDKVGQREPSVRYESFNLRRRGRIFLMKAHDAMGKVIHWCGHSAY